MFEPSVCWHHQWDKVPGGLQEKAHSQWGEGSCYSLEATGDVPCCVGPLSVSRPSKRDTEMVRAELTSYEQRLSQLGEFSPGTKRWRGDLAGVYWKSHLP